MQRTRTGAYFRGLTCNTLFIPQKTPAMREEYAGYLPRAIQVKVFSPVEEIH
jgi:hypothetical protein